MDFKHLQTLTTVIRLQSFSRAAEELYLSQPTISQHIQQIEDELKTRLIIRTTKSIEITPLGREVCEYADRILSLRDRMVETCSVENRRIFHIGASSVPSGYILPSVLPGFRAAHPEIELIIEQEDSQSIIDRLMRGTIDLGLVGMDPEHPRIKAIPFYTDSLVIITPSSERFSKMKDCDTVPLNELLKEPLILREEGSGSLKEAERLLEKAGFPYEKLHVTGRMRDQEAIRNMVAGGLGISILSERAVQKDREAGRILTFPFPSPGSARKLYIIHRSEYRVRSYAADLIRRLCREQGPG